MIDRLGRLNCVFLLAFGAVALAVANWALLRGPGLLEREDNPRLVEAELQLHRGRIFDRNGDILAETRFDQGISRRYYFRPFSPAVGYYSLRYGVSGIEAAYDNTLRGNAENAWISIWNTLLHRYPAGDDLYLTLDRDLQAVAEESFGDRAGAIVLLDAYGGDVLVMASYPEFNPNLLDDKFGQLQDDERAPLLNRAAQARYQPGMALQPFLLAAGLESGVLDLQTFAPSDPVPLGVDGQNLDCLVSPTEAARKVPTVLAYACPSVFVELAELAGPRELIQGLSDMGLFDLPQLPIQQIAPRPEMQFEDDELTTEILGQGELTFTPLQMAWALAVIANEGQRPALRMIQRVGSDTAGWEIVIPTQSGDSRVISAPTVSAITEGMMAAVRSGAAHAATIEHEAIAGHVSIAIAGPSGETHTWFLGFGPGDVTHPLERYAVVVLLESSSDIDGAARIGRDVLSAAIGTHTR